MNTKNNERGRHIIRTIDKKICSLSTEDITFIYDILNDVDYDPEKSAEKISAYLQVSNESIFDLL